MLGWGPGARCPTSRNGQGLTIPEVLTFSQAGELPPILRRNEIVAASTFAAGLLHWRPLRRASKATAARSRVYRGMTLWRGAAGKRFVRLAASYSFSLRAGTSLQRGLKVLERAGVLAGVLSEFMRQSIWSSCPR